MTYDTVKERWPAITNVIDIGVKNDVACGFIEYKDELYFVCCPDREMLQSLRKNMQEFDGIKAKNDMMGEDMFNCYFGIYHIGEITNGDVFSVHQDLCNIVQRMGLIKTCYHSQGYHMPKYVNMESIVNYATFYEKAHSRVLPLNLQDEYAETLRKAVAYDHQYYAKREGESVETKRGLSYYLGFKNAHEVDKDYFLKNHMSQINEVIDDGFKDYMLSHIEDHPEFIYYMEKKPFSTLKDISDIADGDQNYWENMKEVNYWNIAFPYSQASMYYEWVLRYNTRECDHMIPLSEMRTREYVPCLVNRNDLWNINSLCGANNVPFAVNFGELRPVRPGDVNKIPVYFRAEDREMASAIVSRLSGERHAYIPMSTTDQQIAKKNAPKGYHNPFFTDEPLRRIQDKRAGLIVEQAQDRVVAGVDR